MATKDKKKEVEYTEEEKALIERARKGAEREKECYSEIMDALKKYKCNLVVDPSSPVGKPTMKIVLLD